MILNHNLKDLQKELKGLSILERCELVDKLAKETKRMEDRLEYSNKQMLKRTKPKQFCPFNNEIFN